MTLTQFQVDNEILKKELQQKQSLLCEAAKAMELMEEQQKENDEKSHGIIEELNQRIQYLEVLWYWKPKYTRESHVALFFLLQEENKHFEKSAGQQNMDQLMGRSDLMGDVDILQKVVILPFYLDFPQIDTFPIFHEIAQMFFRLSGLCAHFFTDISRTL